MATFDSQKWADSLMEKPISLNDDWGNMLLSSGLAFQQKPQKCNGLGSTLLIEEERSDALSCDNTKAQKANEALSLSAPEPTRTIPERLTASDIELRALRNDSQGSM